MAANYVFGTAIVTLAVATNLREFSRRLNRGDCNGMFIQGLSATGLSPATHFISSGSVPQVYAQTINNDVLLFTRAKAAWEADGDVFPYTQLQVTNALNQCDITNGTFGGQPETPFQAIARLGLSVTATSI